MMMQMLAAGGVAPLTDSRREADESNPRGYFEYEEVKKLTRDRGWLGEAKGKSQLLPLLDPQHDYRVILMDREISEVLASQRTMLDRSGKEGARLDEESLGREFSRQRAAARRWLEIQGIPVLEVSHRDCLTDSESVALRIGEFLGRPLDHASMAAAVAPELWRQR
jgi:hypothetical protein